VQKRNFPWILLGILVLGYAIGHVLGLILARCLVTLLELRALLARVDARQLREDAGISQSTVARALGVSSQQVHSWETGRQLPCMAAGFRWARFVAGLERHAEVAAELEREADAA